MKLPSNLDRGAIAFNMTPMIDIVFLLIIFFLVSSHLAKQEVQLELDLPAAESGVRPDEQSARRMVVNVLADGKIVLGSQSLQAPELQKAIAARRREHKDLEVHIRSHRAVYYRFVEPVMVACAKAGVWNVKFKVVREKSR